MEAETQRGYQACPRYPRGKSLESGCLWYRTVVFKNYMLLPAKVWQGAELSVLAAHITSMHTAVQTRSVCDTFTLLSDLSLYSRCLAQSSVYKCLNEWRCSEREVIPHPGLASHSRVQNCLFIHVRSLRGWRMPPIIPIIPIRLLAQAKKDPTHFKLSIQMVFI